MTRVSRRAGFAVLMVMFVAAGCGGDERPELPMAKVTGTVTYAGHEIPSGRVVFMHERGDLSAATFGADGKYETMVPVGKHQVMIDAKQSSFDAAPASGVRGMETFTSYVPDRYGDFASSNLKLEVTEAGSTFDVVITE